MKNRVKSLFGILLTMLMVFTMFTPTVAQAAGQQEENTKKTVTVRLSAQQENTFFMMPQEYTVSSDKAEEYGFTDKEGVVTALDALVAAHEYVFQEAFTKDTKDEFLKVNESGWISTMFGTETGNVAFAVNGICPHDDVLTDYGYTGYTVADSALKSEDDVEFFFYQDESFLDNYAWFENSGNKVTELNVIEGTPVELTLKGYCYAYYNCFPEEGILEKTQSVEDAQIIVLDQNGNKEDLTGTITDETGTVILNQLSKGTYYISAYTDVENGDIPITSPVCRVTVTEDRTDKLLTGISASYTDATDAWKILEMVKFGKKDALTKLSEYEESAKQVIVKDGSSATDIQKAIIVLSALGYDASALTINGERVNAIEKMLACNLNSANANVFALCALDSGKYRLPNDSTVTRESLVKSLLERRTANKGWAFFGSNADADMTSMAVQSLAPYYLAENANAAGLSEDTYNAVKSAVEGALTCLSNMQKNDGTYSNANSSAMVLMSLVSVGVDGNTDKRFIKGGKSVLYGVMQFALEDNSGFGYTNNTSLNAMATEQGFRALVSYSKFKETKRAYNIYLSGSLDGVPVESVEISETEKLVYKGRTVKLTVSISPLDAANKNVTWTSSDTSVAIVDTEGIVTAKKEGTAVITVTAQEDNSKTASCVITVKEETTSRTEENKNTGTEQNTEQNTEQGTEQSTQQVTEKPVIKLNYLSLSLQKGKSTKAVKIKSSSPSGEKISSAVSNKKNVASVTVSKGVMKITGKKTGTATITVTSTSGATAKIKITVKKKVNVKKLKLSEKRITLKKGKKFKLALLKNPVTATNKIKWSSSNKKVATVNSKGVVKAKKKGKATITAKASNGKKAACKITVK